MTVTEPQHNKVLIHASEPLLTQNCFCILQKQSLEVQGGGETEQQTWWGGCPGWCSMSWGSLVGAAPLCTLHCKTYSSDTMSSVHSWLVAVESDCVEMKSFMPISSDQKEENHSPVFHRTNMVIHHSHGIPVGQGTHHHFKQETANVKHSLMTQAERLLRRKIILGLRKGEFSMRGYSMEYTSILKCCNFHLSFLIT